MSVTAEQVALQKLERLMACERPKEAPISSDWGGVTQFVSSASSAVGDVVYMHYLNRNFSTITNVLDQLDTCAQHDAEAVLLDLEKAYQEACKTTTEGFCSTVKEKLGLGTPKPKPLDTTTIAQHLKNGNVQEAKETVTKNVNEVKKEFYEYLSIAQTAVCILQCMKTVEDLRATAKVLRSSVAQLAAAEDKLQIVEDDYLKVVENNITAYTADPKNSPLSILDNARLLEWAYDDLCRIAKDVLEQKEMLRQRESLHNVGAFSSGMSLVASGVRMYSSFGISAFATVLNGANTLLYGASAYAHWSKSSECHEALLKTVDLLEDIYPQIDKTIRLARQIVSLYEGTKSME